MVTDGEELGPNLPEFLATWQAYADSVMWEDVIARGGDEAVARGAIADLPGASPLEALAANAELVDRLVGWRWSVIRDAREAGATWEAIGDALGITKQAAQDYYRRKVEVQEAHVPGHDAARARAALPGHQAER